MKVWEQVRAFHRRAWGTTKRVAHRLRYRPLPTSSEFDHVNLASAAAGLMLGWVLAFMLVFMSPSWDPFDANPNVYFAPFIVGMVLLCFLTIVESVRNEHKLQRSHAAIEMLLAERTSWWQTESDSRRSTE